MPPTNRRRPLLEDRPGNNTSVLAGIDNSGYPTKLVPNQAENTVINLAAFVADFDTEIVLTLTASGWRMTAILLTHAAKFIEAGDFLSAERNRQRAREQFIEANDLFRQFQEASRVDGILAEGFR